MAIPASGAQTPVCTHTQGARTARCPSVDIESVVDDGVVFFTPDFEVDLSKDRSR